MRAKAGLVAVLTVTSALLAPGATRASDLIARDATGVRLQVNDRGRALLGYTSGGKRRHVLAWGAMDALAPTPGRRQVAFTLDYSGGWGSSRTKAWQTFRNVCGPYRGPRLAWLVTACTAPDGSHWAVQSWQRMLPNYGLPASRDRAAWELRLSHWTGEPATLDVHANWAYRTFDHLFGSFTYRGAPVHGFRSTRSGVPLDTFGRNLYLDTLDSAYGAGWKRENSFLTHKGTGTFCYGFYRHGTRPSGMGRLYRATIIGPGVTPDVMWQGHPLGAYDRARDLALHEEQRTYLVGDRLCKPV